VSSFLFLTPISLLSFAGKWMELENIILSEVSLAQKTKKKKEKKMITFGILPNFLPRHPFIF
jgi:hypothetical protein